MRKRRAFLVILGVFIGLSLVSWNLSRNNSGVSGSTTRIARKSTNTSLVAYAVLALGAYGLVRRRRA